MGGAMDEWFEAQRELATQQKKSIYYARYMDDIVILTHTRWQLRKQVRTLNQFFNEAGFSQYPDKTFIGRTKRGYDWMGAQMNDAGVEGIAHRARVYHLERLRLYEHVRRWPAARRRARMSQYRKKWKIWAAALVAGSTLAVAQPGWASIGTAADLDTGVRTCIRNGDLKNLGNNSWGGQCVIALSARTFSGTAAVRDSTRTDPTVYALLSWPNMPTGNGITLTLLDDLKTMCGTSVKALFTKGTTIPLNTPIPAGQTIGATSCSTVTRSLPAHPYDSSPHIENNYAGAVSGSILWTINVPMGRTLKYPNLILSFDGSSPSTRDYMTIGVGGSNGVDPTPPTPPVAGDPPNCTALVGVGSAPVYDFGNATAGAANSAATTSKQVAAHALTLNCTAGPSGSIKGAAVLSVQSNNLKTADSLTLRTNNSDWLGLRLVMPSSMSGATTAAGQTLGSPVKWNGAAATPLWTWDLPAQQQANGKVTVSTINLQPQIYQVAAADSTHDGTRTYTVTYSVTMQ